MPYRDYGLGPSCDPDWHLMVLKTSKILISRRSWSDIVDDDLDDRECLESMRQDATIHAMFIYNRVTNSMKYLSTAL